MCKPVGILRDAIGFREIVRQSFDSEVCHLRVMIHPRRKFGENARYTELKFDRMNPAFFRHSGQEVRRIQENCGFTLHASVPSKSTGDVLRWGLIWGISDL